MASSDVSVVSREIANLRNESLGEYSDVQRGAFGQGSQTPRPQTASLQANRAWIRGLENPEGDYGVENGFINSDMFQPPTAVGGAPCGSVPCV